jgi:hypothetical protein
VEIAENSENHLKAIVDGRQVADVVGFAGFAGKVAEKTQGEGKAAWGLALGWGECQLRRVTRDVGEAFPPRKIG